MSRDEPGPPRSATIPRRDDSPLLPENYHADEGLSFRTRALSQAEIDQVFGRRIDPGRANRLLRVLHGRRIAGTVGDALPLSESTPPTEQLVDQGLAWLRQNYPVDETTAYEQRMEREVRQKTESRPDQGGGFTLYQPQMGINSRNVYGESGLDAIREHYNRQRTEKPMLYPEELKGRTGTLQTAARTGQLQQPTRAEKNQAYVERAQITKDPRPPVMSMVQRLLPSALFTGAVLLFSIYLADQYTPPPGSGRLWPDLPPAAATIFGLVIANTAIFVGWRIPMCWRFLNRHFLNVPGYPFSTSMLGSVFSHQAPWHLVFNMTVLWIVGTRLHDQIGRGKFLAVYLSSGVFGSFASLAGNSMLGRFAVSSLGASGAISGVFAAWCCLNMK
ncbi:MAG: hypothetical protein M1838_001554 [Thelocarpon superellum]|nr:MAG: hypothetical protein M1838_001554 [Thelocarpon superellum]